MVDPPSWLSWVLDDSDAACKKEPDETAATQLLEENEESEKADAQEESEESAAKNAAEDAGKDAEEEDEEEAPDEEAPEEEEEKSPQEETPVKKEEPAWIVDYSHEQKRAFRVAVGDRKKSKQYTAGFVKQKKRQLVMQ